MLDLATKFEVITKRGAFFSYGDVRIGQDARTPKITWRTNLDLMGEIEGAHPPEGAER